MTGFEDTTIYPTGTAFNYVSVSFPGVAPVLLASDDQVNFAEDSSDVTQDDDATCPGTFNAPSAPAGKVCLYRGFTNNVQTAVGVRSFGPKDLGFTMAYQANVAGLSNIAFSWAYTAP